MIFSLWKAGWRKIERKGFVKNTLLSLLITPFLLLFISGCVPLIVGGTLGAAGGYVISKDTVQGDTDVPYDSLWNAALEICGRQGTVKKEDYKRGSIEAISTDSSLIWIKFIRMTQTATRIRVSSRRFHLPNLNLAQELFTKIIDQAK